MDSTSTSTDNSISSDRMQRILEGLKSETTRSSTAKNYYNIWKIFNKFLVKLDKLPDTWEHRISLFGAHLVDSGNQSLTIKSYFSAIRKFLNSNGFEVKIDSVLLHTLTSACRLINDQVRIKLPIHISLLETLLFEMERYFAGQTYLLATYKCLFTLAYYGLFRIGELTQSDHVIKAKDISIGRNKNKIMIILYSSKTHSVESKPQMVKISELEKSSKRCHLFCPFKLYRSYWRLRGTTYVKDDEPFFIFRDRQPIQVKHVHHVLGELLQRLDLDKSKFTFHCIRSGRATDLLKLGYTIEEIKKFGRWKSNAIYRYLK